MNLKGQVALITGAASGIGRATAVRFCELGADVCLVDIADMTGTSNLCFKAYHDGGHDLTDHQSPITSVVDVTNSDRVRSLIEFVYKEYGKLTCVINNAGILRDAQLKSMSEDQFDQVINVNLKGVYNVAKAAVDKMLAHGDQGSILVTSSIVGLSGNFGQTNYAAAKAGVIGMVKTWARELGKYGIRSNAVCPGFIQTDMTASMPEKVLDMMRDKVPLKRLGVPEDIANTFAFLASDQAAYINGATIEVTGGLTL